MKRFYEIKTEEIAVRAKEDDDLIIPMAFSSEEPVERWWGIEILDHGERSVELDRLNNGAPVLFNHKLDDQRGVHELGSVRVDKDRVLRGKVRVAPVDEITRSTIRRIEKRILTKASIGYRVKDVIEETKKRDGTIVKRNLDGAMFERIIDDLEAERKTDRREFTRSLDAKFGPPACGREKDDDLPIYRVMKWGPFENSFVTVAADDSVGIGRSVEQRGAEPSAPTSAASIAKTKGGYVEKTAEQLAAEEAARKEEEKRQREARERADREAEEERKKQSALELERARRRGIENICKANKLDQRFADMWIGQGVSLDKVADDLVRILEERGKTSPDVPSRLGLTPRETQRYSLNRAVLACVDQDWGKAGFELECSRAIAQKLGRAMDPKNFLVPFEAMERPVDMSGFDIARLMAAAMGKRDLTVATAGAGGYLVATDNVGFIEILRNRSVVMRMGVRRMSGLVGNVTIPRQSAAATAAWLANEASTISESQQTFVQVALSPKNVGAYTEISRQLLLQSSPAAEGIVADDLAQVVALAADLAVLEGSGAAGQPTGLSNTAGIGSVSGTSLAAAGIIEFQTDVASSNVTPLRGGYVTTPAVAGLLMVRPELPTTGTERLWRGNIWDGRLFDFPAMTSNQPTAATMVFGDWQEIILAEWGVLEVSVNPFANFAAGIIGVRAMYSMDVGVRRPFAFSRATTIT